MTTFPSIHFLPLGLPPFWDSNHADSSVLSYSLLLRQTVFCVWSWVSRAPLSMAPKAQLGSLVNCPLQTCTNQLSCWYSYSYKALSPDLLPLQ